MSNLIDNILDLKEKVIVDAGLHKLCDQNSKLTEKRVTLHQKTKKLQIDLIIMQKVINNWTIRQST